MTPRRFGQPSKFASSWNDHAGERPSTGEIDAVALTVRGLRKLGFGEREARDAVHAAWTHIGSDGGVERACCVPRSSGSRATAGRRRHDASPVWPAKQSASSWSDHAGERPSTGEIDAVALRVRGLRNLGFGEREAMPCAPPRPRG
jgi:hypothetical protein